MRIIEIEIHDLHREIHTGDMNATRNTPDVFIDIALPKCFIAPLPFSALY
jgi:hypothetical protein